MKKAIGVISMSVKHKKIILAVALIFAVNILIIALAQSAEAALYKRGSSGATVTQIQTRLKSWGYYSGSVDGIYGSATERGSEQRRSLVAAMREARVVANAEGVAIAEADLSQMVELLETLDPAGMPSMAQDRIARRKTEVEEFSGTICRLAAEHGIEVPQNEWLYQRIREIEASW